MDNDQITFLGATDGSTVSDQTEGYTPKEQELIRQLVQERLGKKNAIEFESLDDYVVPPKMFFSMIKKPAVSIRANRLEFSMSAIRLFEGVQHILPMLSERKKRMVVAICAEEELSSIAVSLTTVSGWKIWQTLMSRLKSSISPICCFLINLMLLIPNTEQQPQDFWM